MRHSRFSCGSSRWAILALAAPALFGAPALATTESSLLVRAYIDGRSRLMLDTGTAQWLHLDYAAPGRLECNLGQPVEPTVFAPIQGSIPSTMSQSWYPQWPDVPDCENRDCNCTSDVFTGVVPALPNASFAVALELVDSRGLSWIVEQPTSANGYRVVIEFDDVALPGAAWYEVVLHLTDCQSTTYCPSTPNSTGAPAQLFMGGTPSISANDCWLEANSCPPGEFCLFVYGQGRAQIPLGNGTLCISPFHPGLVRIAAPLLLDVQGRAECAIDFPALPVDGLIQPGSTWCFQVWYRDPLFGAGNDFTDAIEVTFCS
jgi:hypothetical protein